MNSLLIIFFDLLRLRRGPQDLPSSRNLFLFTGFLLVLTAMLGDHMNSDLASKLIFALTQVVILSIAVWSILSLNGKPERAMQTLTAFYGTSILIQLAVWPFRSWLLSMTEEMQKTATLPLFAVVILAVWSFVVMVYIYRNALECSRGKAILMGILTQLIVGMTILTLFAGSLQMEMEMAN